MLGYVSAEQKKEIEFGILKLPLHSCVTRSQSWSLIDHQDLYWTEELEPGHSGGHLSGWRGWAMWSEVALAAMHPFPAKFRYSEGGRIIRKIEFLINVLHD